MNIIVRGAASIQSLETNRADGIARRRAMSNRAKGNAVEEEFRSVRARVDLDIKVVPIVHATEIHVGRGVAAADASARDGAAAIPARQIVAGGVIKRDVPKKITRTDALPRLHLNSDDTI